MRAILLGTTSLTAPPVVERPSQLEELTTAFDAQGDWREKTADEILADINTLMEIGMRNEWENRKADLLKVSLPLSSLAAR